MSYNSIRNQHQNCDPMRCVEPVHDSLGNPFQCKNKRGFGMGRLYCIEEHAKFHLYAKDKNRVQPFSGDPHREARSDQAIMPL